ncbi:hypothetical protein D3C72_439910 [compost metagenome]
MLKRGPEESGRHQKDKAHQQTRALFAIQTGKDKQVNEVQCHRDCNYVDQHTGHRDGVDNNDALRNQGNDHRHTDGQRQQPAADAIFLRHRAVPGGIQTDFAVVAFHRRDGKQAEDNQRDQHPDTTDAKAPVPAVSFNQPAGDQRRDKRPHVDAHVEQGEAAVTTRIAFLVERANHHRDTGFEQTGTENDKHQADKEQVVTHKGRERDRQMAERNQNRAVPHRALLAEPVIRQPAARQCRQVHAARKNTDDSRCVLACQPHAAVINGRSHKQNQ